MDHFNYRDHKLYAEQVPVADIAAQYGTPCYIYSRATLTRHWQAFDSALQGLPHKICYAVKANSNLAVLNVLVRLGSGFDIVSQGELERVLAAGGKPESIVFSGVGKTAAEMQRALEVGIFCFNIESGAELELLQQVAYRLDKPAAVSIRVNPDVDAKTHPYIATGLQENKFGIAVDDAMALYQHASKLSHIKLHGIDCHIGSQITELAPFLAALDKVLALMQQLKKSGINLQHLNLGGGLGVRYHDEQPPHPSEYGVAIKQRLADSGFNGMLILEPGRAIAANAGILVTQVLYLKTNADKHFAIVDAGMNDLLRPALYQAWQEVLPVQQQSKAAIQSYDIVGPICETGDFIAKQRELALTAGDLLVVRGAGAYGFSMSSNYNSRPRVTEILVDGDQAHLVRARESYAELFSNEFMLP